MERNLFCGKKNTLKHGHFESIAAHFLHLITISQIGQSMGEVWVTYVSSQKYPS